MDIQVDEDVRQMIIASGKDYRICTACYGPALVTTDVKAPKSTDLQIPVGEQILYVSRVQLNYVSRITMDMVYDEDEIDSCPAFYTGRRYYRARSTTSP